MTAPRHNAEASRAALWMTDALARPPEVERLRSLRADPVLLAISRAHAETAAGQLMLATAANVLGRLFDFAPAIDVDVDPDVAVLPGIAGLRAGGALTDELVRLLASLSRRPSRYQYRVGAGAPSYLAALMIGDRPPPPAAREVVYVDGDEWVAAVAPEPVSAAAAGLQRTPAAAAERGTANPFGPLVGATLGAAEIAKCIVRRLADPARAAAVPRLHGPVVWNLWHHGFGAAVDAAAGGPSLASVDLGRIAIAGVGAVGGAALFALTHIDDARGTIELVDDDWLSVTNLERVLVAHAADVGRRKVDVGARALRRTKLRAVPIMGRYDVQPPARATASTVLVGVDSGGARRRIMNLLPDAVYNGGTQDAEILVSRHVGLAGPCLECIYPEPPEPAPAADPAGAAAAIGAAEPECGRVALVEHLPAATISFVAALCGFLVALELVKDRVGRDAGGRIGPLDVERPVLRLDLLGLPPGPDAIESYVPRRDCFCQDPATRRRYGRHRHG